MFKDLFGLGDYYDFPSFEIAIYSLLLSFVLSTAIAFTYRFTFEGDVFPRHFFQAIVLSSMVTCMVIMAVGNNIAAGFGIIGAVAIIRFRTLVRDPRNIIFIFASLSIGIAAGVYGYAIAIAGSLLFCLIAFLLHFSAYGKSSDKHYELTFTIPELDSASGMFSFLQEKRIRHKVTSYRKLDMDRGYRYTLHITLKKDKINEETFRSLISMPSFKDVRVVPLEEVQL
ncbi:MAG: DUF4956 domain-containing protein [Bacteroidota bacterium]